MDTEFLAELREWADQAEKKMNKRWQESGRSDDTALYVAEQFSDLAVLLTARLGAERTRLVAVMEEEQDGPGEIAARRALQRFDAATKGGER